MADMATVAGMAREAAKAQTRRLTHVHESATLHLMTKRLQVLFDDEEFGAIQALARRRRQTTASFVRDALRGARAAAEYALPETKLRAVREAAVHDYPTGNVEELLAQIQAGYLADDAGAEDPPSS